MFVRTLLAVLGLVLVLGTIGSLGGPRWEPDPVTHQVESQTLDTRIGSDADTDPVGTYEVAVEDVEVDLGEVTVLARLASPVDAPPERPGMVLMHGAGTGAHTALRDQARDLASAGIYTLVPQKRLDTYSVQHRDYVQMAADYMASHDLLRRWPGVDPGQVGIYGESEGAYVAAVAGATYDEVAFVALISAPVVPPRQQAAFAADTYLRHTGAPGVLLRAIPRAIGVTIPGEGFEYIDFDPRPYQRQLHVPVLMVYGTNDISMPVVQGARILNEDLAYAGNEAFTVRYYADANHGIRANGALAAGFTDDLARWVLGLPATAVAEPQVAGADPYQQYAAAPVAQPRWYADGNWLMYGLFGSFGALLLGPALWGLARVVPRSDRRPIMPAPLARYAAATALSAMAALVFFLAYLSQVAYYALNYMSNQFVVVGGYLLVLATGVLAAWMLYASVEQTLRHRDVGWRGPGRLVWWTVHLGAASLLLICAYWGVYPAFV